ncbi:putative cation-transporting ATPase F [Microbacterium sp. C448]|uniref:cation-translocating P-type ATPase n=1 Tax=Microbacterium TaxID=33882 RepID=UPI0003DE11B5|nr:MULTISPECIES: HAD-IC family P-type ATPase [Microbacterium]CDJ99639.1 putative cation-transporting ATPase F [Microbacterium sp. C448]
MTAVNSAESLQPGLPSERPPEDLTHHPGASSGSPSKPHAHHATDVLEGLDTSRSGLRSSDVDRRHAHFGPNSFPEPTRTHPIVRFLAQFNNAIIYVLLAAAVIKLAYSDYIDASVILAVAIINAIIGFVQEGQAEKALLGIRRMLSPQATVRRDGGWHDVEAATLVPGDIIRVGAGDRSPADARLVEARDVRADEAALTGEAVPSDKHTDPVVRDAPVGDRDNMLHAGSVVVGGRAVAVVTATGTRTELGRIQQLVRDVEQTDTPLIRSINQLGRQITAIVLALMVIMVVLGFVLHGDPFDTLISSAIAFAVAAVPEGLPAVVTITLALGVRQMAAQRAITRRLAAVETLGSVTVICSDKTGTLTKNEMTVRAAATPNRRYTVTGEGYDPEGTVLAEGATDESGPEHPHSGDLTEMATILALCNDARLDHAETGEWRVVGDPTEGALVSFGRKANVELTPFTRVDEIPFDADVKYMATLDRSATGEQFVSVKGAPDRVLALCAFQRSTDGGHAPLDPDAWQALIDDYSARGMRVLAAARRDLPTDAVTVEPGDLRELVMLGVVAIADPPRPEATAAIAKCQDAGIRVKMITGDHALTAHAIAAEMGLTDADASVLTGADVDALDDAQLEDVVTDVDVYARTSPEHKLRIVAALQSRGGVVAMTGDGVNDAPALTRADVGVAMGMKGTEAAKDASDVVLADDNFATIERAVSEGRRVYDNLQKSVVFILATTLGQALVVFTAVVIGFADPLQPTQILWVNLVTAVTLSLAFAYEPVEPGTMKRRPRPPGESILSGKLFLLAGMGVVVAAATTTAFFVELNRSGDLDIARTAAVTVLVVTQIAVLFNVRLLHGSSFTRRVFTGNRVIWISIAALAALQTAYTYLPPFQLWFGSVPLGFVQWTTAFTYGLAVFLVIEAIKVIGRRAAPGGWRRADPSGRGIGVVHG